MSPAHHTNLAGPGARSLLSELFQAAIAATRGADLLARHSATRDDRWEFYGPLGSVSAPLPTPGSEGRVLVFGAGKATASMARGLEQVLAQRLSHGMVLVKYGHTEPLRSITALECGHPIPDTNSIEFSARMLEELRLARTPDTVFFLLSGGASALFSVPVDAISAEDKIATSRLLVNSGATIHEINAVRKQLSRVKGGKLLEQLACGYLCTLAISDVPGDDPSVIGSGPTVADSSTIADSLEVIERYRLAQHLPARVLQYLRSQDRAPAQARSPANAIPNSYCVIASNRVAVDACRDRAQRDGIPIEVLSTRLQGDTHAAAREFATTLQRAAGAASGPRLFVLSGETTLAVARGGLGGRNQEFALRVACELEGTPGFTCLAAGTDGTDGPTDAAGAFSDGQSVARANSCGLDVQLHLEKHDVYPLLQATGDLYRSGPTGTNVMDLVIALIH